MDILISECGIVKNSNLYELLNNEKEDLRDILIILLKEELTNPKSELVNIIKTIMGQIADEEIEKVLK